MKSIVILYCVLLFCSKFVESIPHSENLVRQRAYPVFDREANQNEQNGQYLDTDLAQTQNKDTLTNSGIKKENVQNFYLNQGYGFNKNSASSLPEKELLVDFDSTSDERKLESDSPREESYPPQTFHVSIDNQQYRNQNWKPQNQYYNSASRTVHIPDSGRPLVTSVQKRESYQGPKYISSLNRRSKQADKLPTRKQYRYPIADNFGDEKYVVPYDSYNEEQAETSLIKTNPTRNRKYVQSSVTKPKIIYKEIPTISDTDNFSDQAEETEYDSSDNKQVDNSPSHFELRGPVTYDIYNEDQASAASEIKTRSTGSQRYVQDSAPEFGAEYNEDPAVIAKDDLIDQSENIKYNSGDNKYVVDSPPRFKSSDLEPHDIYSGEQAQVSKIKATANGNQRYLQNSEPQSGIIYNKARGVSDTDTLADHPKIIKSLKKYKTRPNLSEFVSIMNHDGTSVNSHSRRKNLAENTKIEAPVKTIKHLSEMPLVRIYANNYRSNSEWSTNARDDSSENIEIKSRKNEANFEFDNGPIEHAPTNTYSKACTDKVLVNSANNKFDDSEVPQYKPDSPTIVKTNPSQNVYHKSFSGIKEYNFQNIISNPQVKSIAATNNYIAVVHPNGTVENVDMLNLDAYQNSKVRLTPNDGGLLSQSPVNISNNDTKTPVPVDEYLLPKNRQPSDANHSNSYSDYSKPLYKKPTNENSSNLTFKDLPDILTHFKSKAVNVKQSPNNIMSKKLSSTEPADDDNSKFFAKDANQPEDDNNSTLLPAYKIEPVHVNKLKSKHSNINQSEDTDNSKPVPKYENQLRDNDNIQSLPLRENQPGDDTNSEPLPPNTKQPLYRNTSKSKLSHDLPAEDGSSKLLPQHENQSTYYTQTKQSRIIQPVHEVRPGSSYSYENQTTVEENIQPLLQNVTLSENDDKSKPLALIDTQSENGKNPTSENRMKYDENNYYKQINHLADDDNSKKSPNENQPEDENNFEHITPNTKKLSHHNKLKNKHSDHKLADDDNLKPLPQKLIQSGDDDKPKLLENNDKSELLQPFANQSTYRNISRPKHSHDVPADDNNLKQLQTFVKQPARHKFIYLHESKSVNEDQPGGNNNSEPHGNQPNFRNKLESKHSHIYQLAHDGKSVQLTSGENQSEDDDDSELLQPNVNEPAQNKIKSKPKHKHKNQPRNDENSEPLVVNKPDNYNNSKPLSSCANQPTQSNKSETKQSQVRHPTDDENSIQVTSGENQSEENDNSLQANVNQPAHDEKSIQLTSGENQSEDDDNFESSQPNVNEPAQDKIKSKYKQIYKGQPTENETSEPLIESKPKDYNSSKSLSSYANQPETKQSQVDHPSDDEKSLQLTAGENQSEEDDNSESLQPNVNKPAQDKIKIKSKHIHKNQPKDDENSEPSVENKPNKSYANLPTKLSKPNTKQSQVHQTANYSNSEPLPQQQSQSTNYERENHTEDGYGSKQLHPYKNKSKDNFNSTSSPPVANINDKPTPRGKRKHKHRHSRRKPSKKPPTSMTTPYPDSTDDQIITLSPIEQATDNVSDAPPVTTTAITKPDKNPGKVDTKDFKINQNSPGKVDTKDVKINQDSSGNIDTKDFKINQNSPGKVDTKDVKINQDSPEKVDTKDVKINQDSPEKVDTKDVKINQDSLGKVDTKDDQINQDNKPAKSSPGNVASSLHKVAKISSNSSALLKDDEAVVDTIKHKNKQTNDKTDVNQVSKEKNSLRTVQTAMYNSSELLDTKTDVPVESDGLSVTTSTSVQNDVNTGDNGDTNSSEFEQSETDVITTDSSNTANDSEDDIVTIHIEVAGSTDDADLSSDEKMLLESIDAIDDSSEAKEVKKRRINYNGKDKNNVIDLTNLKGKPITWVRTINQEFLDQLIDNDEAEIDVIYIIQIENHPIIERETETTRFCNGTVLIETTETIYEYKDDPTPTLKKTTKLIEIED